VCGGVSHGALRLGKLIAEEINNQENEVATVTIVESCLPNCLLLFVCWVCFYIDFVILFLIILFRLFISVILFPLLAKSKLPVVELAQNAAFPGGSG